MKIHILTIGDELLIGQVIDTNSAWLGEQLNQNGAQVIESSSISDSKEAITEGIKRALQNADAVLMTGGLGPTKDDITKKTIADFFDVEMEFHQETYDRIERLLAKFKRNLTPEHREQCYMPTNAVLLKNKMGTAPGMWFEYGEKVLISMPGVPYEMKYITTHEVIPRLRERFTMMPIAHRTIRTVGEGESRIAARIENFTNNLPNYIKMAFLPSIGQVRLRLTASGTDELALNQLLDQKAEELIQYIPELVFGREKETLEQALGQLLIKNQKTVAFAESCTGGFLSHSLTLIPGASKYFKGAIIAYSNEVKIRQLGVKTSTLANHGAVSEACVIEMVQGVLTTMDADIAVSISGIAGPTGGSPEKPVGTVWIAIGNQENIETKQLELGKNRKLNIQYATTYALNMIRQFILKNAPISANAK